MRMERIKVPCATFSWTSIIGELNTLYFVVNISLVKLLAVRQRSNLVCEKSEERELTEEAID